ncbi:DUF3084 domain-containing protein [Azotosporobacter soli]|uniref:DUF3084 domain-containing protein n=1 Tax=Azotosporobacter soli TaxID=3055040 RepID=UPI0031FEA82D
MEGIVLIAVLALTGGAIAYIGDRLGTRIGKRKLTVLGLRPRHTSTLITIVSGFLIVAATMGALTIVSQDVRTALFGMEKLKTELAGLSQDVALKNKELEKSHAELKAKSEEYALMTAKVQETSDKLKAVSGELQTVQEQRNRIEKELAAVQAEYQAAKISYEKAQADMAALRAEKAELDGKVESLTQTRDKLQGDVTQLQNLTEKLRQGMKNVREGMIVFRSGELLASAVIDSATGQDEAEQNLRQMLFNTNRDLQQKFEISKPDTEVLWVSQGEFDRVSKSMRETPASYVVRIVAAGNIVYGEPVVAGFDLHPNLLIYRGGSTVYSQLIHVSQERDYSEALMFFLRQLNVDAVKQGVLPEPLRGTVGVMDGMMFYDTVAQMKQAANGGSATLRISATAEGDVHTAGPLRLKLKVERVN